MTNDELQAAWHSKLPAVEATDRDLTAFALGVEVGMAANGNAMLPKMIQALAAIDVELGMPADGCNSTAATLNAIRLLWAVQRDDQAELERLRETLRAIDLAAGQCIGYTLVAMKQAVVQIASEARAGLGRAE
jgi:hypothetical protein